MTVYLSLAFWSRGLDKKSSHPLVGAFPKITLLSLAHGYDLILPSRQSVLGRAPVLDSFQEE